MADKNNKQACNNVEEEQLTVWELIQQKLNNLDEKDFFYQYPLSYEY